MGEVGFRRLRVVMCSMPYCSTRRSYRQLSSVELISRPVSVLRRLIDELVKRRENVIGELHFSDGGGSRYGSSDRESSDSLLSKRSVKHSVVAVFFHKAHTASENTAEFNILAEEK